MTLPPTGEQWGPRWGTTAAMRVLGLALAAMMGGSSAADAQLDQTLFRGVDGTAYQVLRVSSLSDGAEKIRVTTLAGSAALVGSCAEAGITAGEAVSAIGGTVFSMALYPYAAVRRTFVLAPNDIGALSFDETASGRVTLGTGAGLLNVCSSLFDCMGIPNLQTLVGLDSNQGNVPPACIAADLNAACDGTNTRDAFAFGLPASGFPRVCDDSANVTVSSTLCATQPADGFDLSQGQAIVFVYGGSLMAFPFVAVGGFDITTDGVDPAGCAANSIVGAAADSSSSEPPPPTNTPRATATATASPTPSHPGPGGEIPVIPSPTDPAGLVLVIGLGAGLLFAVRRVSRR